MSEKLAAFRSKRTRLLLAAVVVAGAVGAWQVNAAGAEEPVVVADGAVVEVGVLTVGLRDGVEYARVGIALVLDAAAVEADVEPKFALVKDAAIGVVAGFSAEELRGPEGLDELRSRLTEGISAIYPDGTVRRVVLVEALVK
ncbi:MAG: flagellar basal body-associated FliL family protein [Acidimicrobiia bacterium]